MLYQILLVIEHWKKRWSLSSILDLQKTHMLSTASPHWSILFFVGSLFRIAIRLTKECPGIASLDHNRFHRSTFSSLFFLFSFLIEIKFYENHKQQDKQNRKGSNPSIEELFLPDNIYSNIRDKQNIKAPCTRRLSLGTHLNKMVGALDALKAVSAIIASSLQQLNFSGFFKAFTQFFESPSITALGKL